MRRILVVDDEEIIVNTVAGQLENQFDAEIQKANHALEAMELLKKMKFDIVITDISMPKISGMELLDFVKENWPSCHVIIMTAYNEFEYAYHTLKYDRVDYVQKIDGYEALAKIVAKHLNQLQAEDEQEAYYHLISNKEAEMSAYFRSRAVDKLLGYGMPVGQNELDLLQLPLLLERRILFAVGSLQEMPVSSNMDRIFSITDYIEKKMEQKQITTVFQDRNGILFWIFQTEKEKEAVLYIKEIFSELTELVNLKMNLQFSVVINEISVVASELFEYYQRAVLLLEQNLKEGCVCILPEGNFENAEGDTTYPSAEELNFLFSLLKKKKDHELLETIRSRMSFLRSFQDLRKALPLPSVSALELLYAETKRLYQNGKEDTKENMFLKLYRPEIKISGTQWLDGVLEEFESLLRNKEQADGMRLNHLAQWMDSYIEQHYLEPISLTLLADETNYNPAYLSRVYKEQTGKTLMETVNQRRMNEALKLLDESAMKIKDIAEITGFYSVKHFNEVFKRCMGISAGEYRKKQKYSNSLISGS